MSWLTRLLGGKHHRGTSKHCWHWRLYCKPYVESHGAFHERGANTSEQIRQEWVKQCCFCGLGLSWFDDKPVDLTGWTPRERMVPPPPNPPEMPPPASFEFEASES